MKLTDTQLVVLSAALAREDGSILPLPAKLKGGAAGKVCGALLARELAEEVRLSRKAARENPKKVYADNEAEGPRGLRLTKLAEKALGTDAESMTEAGQAKEEAAPPASEEKRKAPRSARRTRREEQTSSAAEHALTQPRSGTKLDRLVELLRRPDGVSIKEAAKALDWMEHSVRGAVAGALKKKYGLAVNAEKLEGRGTVYRIAG
ncbi:MAG TPA: DUF3489 domain-containing protein [Bauldia sp.]|nr:DUF3489 domain-containing protein [Bauldia sp.]